MPDSNNPIHWSASEIARRIARREISSVDATQAFIRRIEAVDSHLNAIAIPRFELALQEAKAAGLTNLKGHRVVGGMRASLYNAMPEAGVDALVSFMADFAKRHG